MYFNFRAMWTLRGFAQDHNLNMKKNSSKAFLSLLLASCMGQIFKTIEISTNFK